MVGISVFVVVRRTDKHGQAKEGASQRTKRQLNNT